MAEGLKKKLHIRKGHVSRLTVEHSRANEEELFKES